MFYNKFAKFVAVLCCVCFQETCTEEYKPNWASLDARPLPTWYDKSKIGVFIHWGVFSVPSFGDGFLGEWFWQFWKGQPRPVAVEFMKKNYPPNFQYADFAPMFTAELYDPNHWADVLKASGAKYVVLTSKHHEGYTNWPSINSWNWNSMDVGPNRDLVGDLAKAIRNRTSIRFGLYHSLYEWFNPLYLKDKKNMYTTQDFVRTKTMPELYDIVRRYKPEVIFSDGQWEADSSYWNSTHFLAWLYNSSPVKQTIVTNDRWGKDTLCKHGGYLTCRDHYNPGVLQKRKFENAMTIDKGSWGFRRNAELADYITIQDLLQELVTTISCGGNLLINIGPTKSGTIAPIYEERLRQMGQWLQMNGEAVYGSKPWKYQNDTTNPHVWYTAKQGGDVVYAFLFQWSQSVTLRSPLASSSSATVDLLGGKPSLVWMPLKEKGVKIEIPAWSNAKWVMVLRLTGFAG
ncbi:alpha-L-fucosidase-like [Clavelina lepadiformis]|uniref:alpha-L-fucosidase n=1 Tax=Clavelina lepadiformis TaxID=159417 RepID=A0ABP0H093_CLALP